MSKQEYYCIYCLQKGNLEEFSKWLDDATKARKCNRCHGKSKIKEMIKNNEIDRKCKRESESETITPILTKISSSEESKRRKEVTNKISEKCEQMRIDDEIGL